MLYKFANLLREGFQWIWETVERLNGWLFAARYSAGLRQDMGGGKFARI